MTPTPSLTATETPTSAPTATPDDVILAALDVIRAAAESTCTGDYYPIPKTLTFGCGTDGCSFDCDHHAGHRGSGSLTRYPTSLVARDAFDRAAGGAIGDYAGTSYPSSFWSRPGNPGEYRDGILQARCWLATANSFDDTDYAIAPQPASVIEAIYERAVALGLFDLCPLRAEVEVAREILSGFTRYAHCPVAPLTQRALLPGSSPPVVADPFEQHRSSWHARS